MSREMNMIADDMSLHEIKNRIQLKYMAKQADAIANELTYILENTSEAAPVRTKRAYKLKRGTERRHLRTAAKAKDACQEKHWEEACYWRWLDSSDGLASDVPFRRLISYQVMLRDANSNRGWGEIDLLGATAQNLPVVIELKSKFSEPVLGAIVEAVAYGVAVRKAWNSGELRKQWETRLGTRDLPPSLDTCELVVAATTDCWRRWIGGTGEALGFRTPVRAWGSIRRLVALLRKHGFKIAFVEIGSRGEKDPQGLPVISAARTVALPRSWREGPVDKTNEHMRLFYGDADAGTQPLEVALLAPAKRGQVDSYVVEFVPPRDGKTLSREVRTAVEKEINYYLLEKDEKDPWQYAIYHCGTAANVYSPVHWSYYPKGQGSKTASADAG